MSSMSGTRMNLHLAHRSLLPTLRCHFKRKALLCSCVITLSVLIVLFLASTRFEDFAPSSVGPSAPNVLQVTPSSDIAASLDNVTNPHNFSLLINQPTACYEQSKELLALVVVVSDPANFKRRKEIRQTWGHRTIQNRLQHKLLFALGRSPDGETNQEVEIESAFYRDIVQEDFIDSYRNLSLKSIMILKWATIFCNFVPYILKIDDDMFLNVYNYMRMLTSTDSMPAEKARKNTFVCRKHGLRSVFRGGKYGVSASEYPGDTYPEFCSGPAYSFPIELARRLYRASLTTPRFALEDVYVSGILRETLNATIFDIDAKYERRIAKFDDRIVRGDAIFPEPHTPGFTPRLRNELWKKILIARNQTIAA